MAASDNNIIYFDLTVNKLINFLKKIKDLTTINEKIVMRIESDKILIFSFVGENFKNIHAFKNYIFSLDEVMEIKKGVISSPLLFIIRDGKKFHRILNNFTDYENNLKCKLVYDEDNYVNFISFDNTKLNTKIIGGNGSSVKIDISIDDVNYLMNGEKCIFNFRLNKLDFLKIKKMSLIENEPKSVLYIIINNKKLSIGEGETKWHLNITDIDYEDIIMSFPKSYFNTISPEDFIEILVFDNFIICKYDSYNLMIILETSI